MSRATSALTLHNINNLTAQPRTVFLCVCNVCTKEMGSYSKISLGENCWFYTGQLLEDLSWRKLLILY